MIYRKCIDCSFALTSRQLRIQNCKSTLFHIAVCSAVALEESNQLKFGKHPNLAENAKTMAMKNMVILQNSETCINDFEWPDKNSPSPNWTVII